MKQANLVEEDPQLSFCLCFNDGVLSRRYEEYTMQETPLSVLMVMMILSSLTWTVTLFSVGSELSLLSTVAMCFTYTPFILGFLYCYTVWIFQTKREVSIISTLMTSFNQLAIKNICFIGSAMVLLNSICFGVTFLLHNNDNSIHNDEGQDTISSIVEYQNLFNLVIIPVMFPIHSYVASVVVLPLCFLVTLFSTSNTPPLAIAQLLASIAVVLYYINIGNRKRILLNLEFEETKSALVQAEDKLQRIASQTTDMHHMIGSMAHDLKTPLQAFTFELENLSNECQQLVINSPNKLSDFKKMMEDNCSQLQTIIVFMTMAINRSLDYTKASTGVELVPSLSLVDLPETTSWITTSLTHKIRSSVAIVVEPLPVEISATIMTDKQWLIENIFCYLSNAQKFTSEGQIIVRCVLPSVPGPPHPPGQRQGHEQRHEDGRQSPLLIIEVEDSGIGLSVSQKQHLFQPFKQAQSRAGGTGLGLFSLRKRVASLGGDCGVRDRPYNQSGSIFWFSFPYFPDTPLVVDTLHHNRSHNNLSSHDSPVSALSDETLLPPNFRRILVVDDSIMIQKATKRSLEREGYVVDVANNGYECLKLINSQDYRYDLILLDLNMPIMDGLETVTRLRDQEFKSRFGYVDSDDNSDDNTSRKVSKGRTEVNVVVGFSANSDAATKAEALEAGMDAFLSKPLSSQDLRTLSSFMKKEVV